MTTNKELPKRQSNGDTGDLNKSQKYTPYESIVSQVVTKIKNEPFLFVIAIVALLIGLTVLATGIGSSDLRFIVIVIALLAILVILGYYLLAVLQMRAKMQQEAWKYQQRPQAGPPDQLPSTEATDTGTDNTSKFRIEAPGATIGAIGDHANVVQNVVSASHPSAGESPIPDAYPSAQRGIELEQLLSQHQHNLARLQAKKAVYASGEEPLSLLNQIEDEQREIQRIQTDLAKHTDEE